MGKGDTYRPHSTTREEQDLRERYARTDMTRAEFDVEFEKLKRQGLVKRNGKVIT